MSSRRPAADPRDERRAPSVDRTDRRCPSLTTSSSRPAQAGVLPPLASTVKRAPRWAMRDFLFAAWFLWMTPLLTALSSRRGGPRRRGGGLAGGTGPAG